MAIDMELQKLQMRALDWDIHSGEAYGVSSVMGLNFRDAGKQPDTVLAFGTDTGHDLMDIEQFKDFMDSRAQQAEELSVDLKAYEDIVRSRPDFPETTDGKALIHNFAERAVMALYGVDESKHKAELGCYMLDSGEAPYATSVKGFEDIIKGITYESSCSDITGRLDDFATEWRSVSNSEKFFEETGVDIASEPGAFLKYRGVSRESFDVHTWAMASRYVSEVVGRSSFFERCCGVDSGLEPLPHLYVNSPDPYVAFELRLTGAVAKETSVDMGRRKGMFDSQYLTPFALDGESIVIRSHKEARETVETNPKLAYLRESPHCPARPFRDVSDLDAACNDIAGFGVSGPDAGKQTDGEDFPF